MLLREIPTPRGTMILGAEDGALRFLTFPGAPLPCEGRRGNSPVLDAGEEWLRRYFAGERPGELPACAPRGSVYAERIWSLLREIPYGHTVSYGFLAALYRERFGLSTSARAVGGAVGRNPLPVLLACHRVVGADGSLTGFAGGLEWKAWLLALEKNGSAEIM